MAAGRRRCAAVGIWLVVGLLAGAGAARAQLIDSVDVERRGKEARISIRFTTTVQYLRHAPPESGKTLLIYLQVTGVRAQSAEVGPQTVSLPQTDLVPHLSVIYPAAGNALELDFSQATSYHVSWSVDGRSIDITVPILAGARDWAVQVKAPPPAPKAPAPAATPNTRSLRPVFLMGEKSGGMCSSIHAHTTLCFAVDPMGMILYSL